MAFGMRNDGPAYPDQVLKRSQVILEIEATASTPRTSAAPRRLGDKGDVRRDRLGRAVNEARDGHDVVDRGMRRQRLDEVARVEGDAAAAAVGVGAEDEGSHEVVADSG